ncbi:acyltransferase family protein [Nocardioides sp.]|uniref:acyltransferase family protein n=1 Tax=Nocardioides sp. TaxID=35761 RepID=UPI003518A7CB
MSAPSAAPSAARSASRDPWFDNAKMTILVLVVVGHAWGQLPATAFTTRVEDALYAWHMPAMILISGYFSRSADWSAPRLWALLRTIAVPYVLFEAAYAAFALHVEGYAYPDPFWVPIWPLWYLCALLAWRLLTPVLLALPARVALGGSVAVSLLGGLWDVEGLALSRVVGMLPFFVVGLLLTREHLEVLRRPAVRLAAPAVAVLVWQAAPVLERHGGIGWLYFRPYAVMDAGPLEGIVVRSAVLAVACAATAVFLAWVPRRDGWFTACGTGTMSVFLLHGFVLRAADAAGFGDFAARHPVLGAVVVVVSGTGLALALAAPRVSRALDPVLDPFEPARRATWDAVRLHLVEPDPPGPAVAEPVRTGPVTR